MEAVSTPLMVHPLDTTQAPSTPLQHDSEHFLDKEQTFIAQYNKLVELEPENLKQSVDAIVLHSDIPKHYPTFAPVLSSKTAEKVISAPSLLTPYDHPSSNDNEAMNDVLGKTTGVNRYQYLTDRSTQFVSVLNDVDSALSSAADDITFQLKNMLKYLNKGVATINPFSYGPYNPNLFLKPHNGTDPFSPEATTDNPSGKASGDDQKGPYSATQTGTPKKAETSPKPYTFTTTEENGVQLPLMSLSLDDIIKGDDAKEEGGEDEEGKEGEEGEPKQKTKPKQIRFNVAPSTNNPQTYEKQKVIVVKKQELSTENFYAGYGGVPLSPREDNNSLAGNEEDAEKENKGPSVIVQAVEDVSWMRCRICDDEEAVQKVLKENAKRMRRMKKKDEKE
ncbi:hypothetical protein BLNAU_23175 [Blattamonas nauphoetae]|uniref:Uncharacterized protein n=1 Tax=Blattamonas nauphoetae TaxID=2049346 RepID=A0ABQ9WR06_9EUKA|nr:hypothetical protein BLNAU_23175 [Blattamonas nauphoetae]